MNLSTTLQKQKGHTLLVFILLELLCVFSFGYFMYRGAETIAWLFLLVPFQIVAWILLFRDSYFFLLVATVVAPLSVCALIPDDYHKFIFFPSTIFFLIILRFTSWLNLKGRSYENLLIEEKLPGLLLFIWIIISFLLAFIRGRIHPFFITCNLLIVEAFILSYFFAVVPRNMEEIRKLIAGITVGVIICVLLLPILVKHSAGFVDTFGGKKLITPFGVLDLNALGLLVATLASAMLGALIGEKRFMSRLVLSAIVLILLAGLVFSRSRGAWFGFGIALLYLLFKTRSPILGLISGVGGLLILLLSFFRSLFISRLESTTLADPAFLARIILWNFGLLVARKNWIFGVGWENFRFSKYDYGYPKFADPKVYFSTHNLYLETMADLGIFGFLFFVVLLFGIIFRMNRLVDNIQPEYRYVALGVTAALITFAAHSVFDSLSSTFMVIGMWFGLALAIRRLSTHYRTG